MSIDLNLDYMLSLKIFLETEYNIDPNSHSSIIRHLFNFLKDMEISNGDIKTAITLLYESENPEKVDEMYYILNRLLTRQTITTNLSDLFSSYRFESTNITEKEDDEETIKDDEENKDKEETNEDEEDKDDEEDKEDEEETKEEEDETPENRQNILFQSLIDQYTNELINPANVLNYFTTNLNNMNANNIANFQLIYTSPVQRIISPLNFTFYTDMITFNEPINTIEQNSDPRIVTHENGKESLSQESLDANTTVETFSILDPSIKEKYDSCPICFDDFKDENIVRKIQCTHIFHKDCIDPWLLNENYKCPVCRKNTLSDKP